MRGFLVVAALAACSSDPPPSCQIAIGHFYGAGCHYIDTSTGSDLAEVDVVNRCITTATQVTPQCKDAFDAWLTCNDSVQGSGACASCSDEYMTLLECH